ncbi:MAG: DUF4905 domain-containing protein [Chlorobiaceae bacterium]
MKNTEKQLSLRWKYHAGSGALVWQLMFTETGDLIGQKRLVAERQSLFFCIDTVTGKVLLNDYLLMDHFPPDPAGEGWFTGLETTSNNLGYCYACQPQSPEHKGIWAVDFRTGRVVWSRPDIGFVANLNGKFLVSQSSVFGGFPERQFLLLDSLTGNDLSLPALDSAQVNAVRADVVPEEVRQKVILPEFVTEGMAKERLVLQQAGISDTGRCECIVKGMLTVVARHEQAELSGTWHSFLDVWHKDRLVYVDCLEKDVDSPGFNNFLIQSDNLYYIKEKEELICVALS